MASKRMFSKEIVQSSRFLRLPPTCRLLYYDIGMNADDDGFCEWYPVIQMTGAKEADLEVLARAELIHVHDREVLIIKDWKVNNLIRSDRYQPSKYLGKYPSTEPLNLGIPSDNQMTPQVRLGKDRLENTQAGSFFEEFWAAWPKKVAKEDARRAWKKIVMTPEEKSRILAAIEAQKNSDRWLKDNGQFIPYPASWLNGRRWEDEIGPAIKSSSTQVI